MKHRYYFLLLFAALVSCKGGTQSDSQDASDSINASMVYDTLTKHIEQQMFPDQEFPSYQISMSVVALKGTNEKSVAINHAIANFLFGTENQSLSECLQHYADSVQSQFTRDLAECYDPEFAQDAERFAYLEEFNGELADEQADGYLVYQRNINSYQGGAHGSYCYHYLNIRLSDGKVMRKADVFKPGTDADVCRAILNALLTMHECSSQEELQEKTSITLLGDLYVDDHNFQLRPEGILFNYNTYEIAPYSEGMICAFVPYEKLNGLLNNE